MSLVYNESQTLAQSPRLREVAALFSPSNPPGDLRAANVTTRAALPQKRVEMPIGSQTNYEIKTKIRIHFYKITLQKELNI